MSIPRSGAPLDISRLSKFDIWRLAIRPPTLMAAVAPVVVGTAVAARDGVLAWLPAGAAMVGGLALQVAANLANDVSDFRHGADTEHRIGPPRVTQLGLLTEREVVAGLWVAIGVATLAGLYLTAVAGWPVVAIGLSSIGALLAYTGGPWPFGYRGLGEVFVFAFFGVAAVVGTYYVQALRVSGAALGASIPVGLTTSAILVVNNVRDIHTDRVAGKRTLAVILGPRLARWHFVLTLVAAYLAAAALWLLGEFSAWTLLAFLSLPLAWAPTAAVLAQREGPALNTALRATARLHLVFGLLLAVGVAR
ncbi:MAG: 1,4-dihydroxy-2-naphthoate polyprenyltransferase [Dehalococcoidia bacterium]